MTKKLKRKTLIGRFQLGQVSVDLVAVRDGGGGGGTFTTINSHNKPEIVVNIDDSWEGCCGTLVHEAFEAAALMSGVTYQPEKYNIVAVPSLMRTFLMTHMEFSVIAEYAGRFVAESVEGLKKEWQKGKK